MWTDLSENLTLLLIYIYIHNFPRYFVFYAPKSLIVCFILKVNHHFPALLCLSLSRALKTSTRPSPCASDQLRFSWRCSATCCSVCLQTASGHIRRSCLLDHRQKLNYFKCISDLHYDSLLLQSNSLVKCKNTRHPTFKPLKMISIYLYLKKKNDKRKNSLPWYHIVDENRQAYYWPKNDDRLFRLFKLMPA